MRENENKKEQRRPTHSPLHCCRLSPKAGTSQLRYHSAPVGLAAGVLDAFSSVKLVKAGKGTKVNLNFEGILHSGLCKKVKARNTEKQRRERKQRMEKNPRDLRVSSLAP